MKKLFTIAIVISGVVAGYAQGTVNFNNNVAFTTAAPVAANGHNDRLVYDMDNTTKLVTTNYLAQLYYAVGANQAESALNPIVGDSPSRFRVATTSSPGTWSGVTSKTLPGALAGQTVTLQVRVWDGSLFANFDAAMSGGGKHGKSVTFNYTIPSGGTPPPSAFFMEGLQSFTLVPEPSTYALAGLAVGGLLMFRRRKN